MYVCARTCARVYVHVCVCACVCVCVQPTASHISVMTLTRQCRPLPSRPRRVAMLSILILFVLWGISNITTLLFLVGQPVYSGTRRWRV